MQRIEIYPETRSVGSVTSPVHKKLSKTMKYRYIDLREMDMINMNWNHSKLIYDSQINDSKCQFQSLCILTSSQPLMRRANTIPSCDPVWLCLVSQQSKLNYKYSMLNTKKRAIFVLSWTI